ncbi:MAG: hypothetical protein AAB658_15350, partial [Chloroflexota bacterium]
MSRLYNLFTGLVLILTLAFVVWAAIVVAKPESGLNPFPPPSAVVARVLPPLLVTAAPTRTFTSTFTATNTPTPTTTATAALVVARVLPPLLVTAAPTRTFT